MRNLKRQLAYFWTLGWSFFTLLLERLWDSFWPLATIVTFYAGLSLTQVVLMFGNTGHIVLLGLFTAAAAFAGLYLGMPFRLPRRREVERRIELESGLRHRPLDMMHDRPAPGTDAAAAALFNREKEARKRDWDQLKIWRPRPEAAVRDRFALRHAALLFLVVGLVMAQQDAWFRLSQGLRPQINIPLPGTPVSLDIWAQPPGYTGKAPVFLATAQLGRTTESAATVPAGSLLKIRIGGTASTPKLTYAGKAYAFTQAADKSFTLEIPLTESGTADVRLGWFRKLGQWPIGITPDKPPAVSLLLVTPTDRAGTKIVFDARDDYGIKNLTATITPVDSDADDPWLETLYLDVPFIRNAAADNQNHTFRLARHPMSGTAVRMTLTAEDDAGNISTSNAEVFVLPERNFENPIAARLNLERKRLTYFNNGITRKITAQTLAHIANRPHFFNDDPVVFLGLVVAVKRLGYDGDPESVAAVRELLWDLALRVEEGGLAQARDDLTQALQKLTQALNNPDTGEEQLQQIMQEVAEKMRAYMQALANEMRQLAEEQMQDGEQLSPELAQRIRQEMDMEQLMQQMQNMSDPEARQRMQDMMEQLRRAVENASPEEIREMQQRQAKATKAMNDLQKVIHAQQALVDQAHKSDGTKEDLQEMGEKEGGLRRQLDQITEGLGQGMPVPESLGEAGDLMEQAQEAFNAGNLQEGGKQAKAALDKLQQGMDQSVQFMAEQMKQLVISFGGRGQRQEGPQGECPPEERDPLGNCPGSSGTGSVKIPDEQERRRVQEIIRELRGRSNNWERPRIEREYIDRLLNN